MPSQKFLPWLEIKANHHPAFSAMDKEKTHKYTNMYKGKVVPGICCTTPTHVWPLIAALTPSPPHTLPFITALVPQSRLPAQCSAQFPPGPVQLRLLLTFHQLLSFPSPSLMKLSIPGTGRGLVTHL